MCWNSGTGELYEMRLAEKLGWADGRGGWSGGILRNADLVTHVLGGYRSFQDAEAALAGWEEHAEATGGLEWVRQRAAATGWG